jgi:glycine/D-amino acid oxidase-like deaminating enzyme
MNGRSRRPKAEPVDVVVVGAGQAGLAVSYYLRTFSWERGAFCTSSWPRAVRGTGP